MTPPRCRMLRPHAGGAVRQPADVWAAVMMLFTLIAVLGCADAKQSNEPMPRTNLILLKEVGDAGSWFHARKTRPIWVKKLEQDQTVQTLEGDEQVQAGAYLCRGEAGDIWPQSEERLTSRYVLTDDVDPEGWRRCDPHPDAEGVMAAQVPHAFEVQAEWGLLSGKSGDYVVKNYGDRQQDDPQDVWIVDQALFQATYEPVGSDR